MKIIVSSEAEKELIQKFVEFLNDCDVVDDVEKLEEKYCKDAGVPQSIGSDEYCFIANGFYDCKVEVDGSIYPMTQEHHIIQGTCVNCGENTEGTLDGDNVSYDEYLEYMSEGSKKTWLCEDCTRNGVTNDTDQCQECHNSLVCLEWSKEGKKAKCANAGYFKEHYANGKEKLIGAELLDEVNKNE